MVENIVWQDTLIIGCQGGLSSVGFFALTYLITSLIYCFYKKGDLSIQDLGLIILISIALTIIRTFLN